MEQLQKDLMSAFPKMEQKDSSKQSFLELVGYDTNNSFHDSMQFYTSSATNDISIGGQSVTSGSFCQTQVRMNDCLVYCDKSGIMFDLVLNNSTFIDQVQKIFSVIETSIGQITVSSPFAHVHAHQRNTRRSAKWMKKYSKGLIFADQDQSQYREMVPTLEANLYTNVIRDASLSIGGGNAVTAPSVTYLQKQIVNLIGGCRLRQFEDLTYKCFVPFSVLSPWIEKLQDKTLYLGLGQVFKMNSRLLSAQECSYNISEVEAAENRATSYIIRNAQLVVSYTQLDSQRVDMIQKSTIPLQLTSHIPYVLQQTSDSVNAIYQVSKRQKIKGLWISNPYNQVQLNGLLAENTYANLTTGTKAQFKTPQSYFPQLPIRQIIILIGSQQVIINQQILKGLHLIPYKDYEQFTYSDPCKQQMQYAYYLPLTRFIQDALGSSGQEISQVTVQIQYDTTLKTLPQQTENWSAAIYAFFSFYSFLELEEVIQCKNGIYQYV